MVAGEGRPHHLERRGRAAREPPRRHDVGDDPSPALHEVETVPAVECAAGIADALESDNFEHYVPAELPGGMDARDLAVAKVRDCNGFLSGMAAFTQSLRESR